MEADKKGKKARKTAIALKYDQEKDEAPIIAASGSGYVAERIIQEAEENEVPVVYDKDVSEVLAQFSVGDAIPPALYDAVAQILIFISGVDKK